MEEEYPLGTRVAAGAATLIVPWILNGLFGTCKVVHLNPEFEREIMKRPIIGATLHKHFLFIAWYFQKRGCVMMVSRSKDGEIITRVCHRMGTDTVRGSSSRYGKEALLDLIRLGREGRTTGLIVDGPRGPAGVSKMGVVVAAREIGQPIVPIAVAADDAWEFRNWDRTALPRPWSRLAIKFGEPIEVPGDADKDEMERCRLRIDEAFAHMNVELRVHLARSR